MLKVVSVVGARPQFIKCAPVSRALRQSAKEILVHTGQHYDENMSEVFFRELEIPVPDHNLGVGSGTHGQQTAAMLEGIEAVIYAENPQVVLLYGDTNSTLAGALAASKLHVPVAHVEAGLRSFNRAMPEELNRLVTDHLSDLLFCPTQTAVDNLRREGITGGIELVGDVMLDALLHNVELARERSTALSRLGVLPKEYFLATIHRAENTDRPERLRAILEALLEIASAGFPVVVPLHPRTRKMLPDKPRLNSAAGVMIIEPLSYLEMLELEDNARAVLTDSGGVQKEAFWLSVPCVTLRDETEWVETVESGWNLLAGADKDKISRSALQHPGGTRPSTPTHQGERASTRIVDALLTLELNEGRYGRPNVVGGFVVNAA